MTLPCIIIMIVGVVAALFGMNKQKQGAAWGQGLAIVGAIVAIGAALWNVGNTVAGGSTKAAIAREQRYVIVEHKYLGEAIKKAMPNVKKAVVLVDPMTKYDVWGDKLETPLPNVALEGLKEGLGADVEIVEVCPPARKNKKPAPGKEDMAPPPVIDIMTFASFNKLMPEIEKAKADVFVCLYMLPMEVPMVRTLSLLKGKKVALANVGELESLKRIFQDGGKNSADVVAVVTSKMSAVYDESIPSSEKAIFNKRYTLITKDNYTTEIDAALKADK